ncbi:undecaprenyl-diphosphate phosphatase [Mammaliicoccus stepanovicii]|uniref:Undecaprenyl-diphosphatase n=1 Tax=Mammaliicoccus stepanovicii TaxID=643214 RepID=A0A239YGZ4_9STAP|nr:undecaprenyl-diphosphate phosphatase [Mammaliicoccus stepanovicii]PNZ74714.1 UDP pyrophosphate phosphatase [Mammaliicoccus stepanovicii]GGI40795.1 undecaprenyl-diphosphatase 1 [Mammaliicoccus stepanovicii]SNV58107.1 undecaprenyl-diphosphatase UppP [Mammaliicoccus stepanovicii]
MVIIEIIKYIFLGLLQGITEPIPISSSGHLVMAQEFLGLHTDGLTFEIVVNTASLVAVLFLFRKDIIELIIDTLKYLKGERTEAVTKNFQLVIYLIIATIPAGILGVIFKDIIGDTKSVIMVGIMLIVTGIALWFIKNKRGQKLERDLTLKDAIIVGLFQAIALIPGISRSGATIVGALGVGMNQKTAFKFSFLLYIPVSLGTALLGVKDMIDTPIDSTLMISYVFAFIASLIASYFSLKWLKGIMERGQLGIFSIYCFIVGPLAIILALIFL